MALKNFIVADWGSSNIRLFLYINQQLVQVKKSDQGITQVQGQACEALFKQLCEPWFKEYGLLPTVLAGMVGSVNGWKEAQYLSCPVDLAELKQHLVKVEVRDPALPQNIYIVPGLCVKDPDNFNVIRGEETQLVGALQLQGLQYYLMPGTHCKWVKMQGSKVESFRTVMTGELHKLLLTKSLVGMGAGAQELNPEVFNQGLAQGLEQPCILPRLFEVRGRRLVGGLKPSYVSEFLSGLLIGSEISSMVGLFKVAPGATIGVIGSDFLNQRYIQALTQAHFKCIAINGDEAFKAGILPLASQVDLSKSGLANTASLNSAGATSAGACSAITASPCSASSCSSSMLA